ncbi:MAG: hypothetical protein RTU30_00925 [Candidatus Thorarchaeota archaeon]
MTDVFYTCPIIGSNGSKPDEPGRMGTMLGPGQYADACIIIPKTGNIRMAIVCSTSQPNNAVNMWVGYTMGGSGFPEQFTGFARDRDFAKANTYVRFGFNPNTAVKEGDYLGIRVQNKEAGHTFNLSAVYIMYM